MRVFGSPVKIWAGLDGCLWGSGCVSVLVPMLRAMEKITEHEQYDSSPEQAFLVYGTLREGMSNHSLLRGRATLISETVMLPGYRMTVSPNGGHYPYIVRAGLESITAEVWSALPGEYEVLLRSLDSLEGYHPTAPGVNHYDRIVATYLDSSGYMCSGWLYVASAWTAEEIIMGDSEVVEGGDWVTWWLQDWHKASLN